MSSLVFWEAGYNKSSREKLYMLHRISGCSWTFLSAEIPWYFYTWALTSSTWGIHFGGGRKRPFLNFLLSVRHTVLPLLWISQKTFLARVFFPVFLIIPLKQGQNFGDQGNSIVIFSFLSPMGLNLCFQKWSSHGQGCVVKDVRIISHAPT